MKLPAAVINGHLRYLTKPLMRRLRSHKLIRGISGMYEGVMFRPSRAMSFTDDELVAGSNSVPCTWCSMGEPRADKIILYLHGGAFTMGSMKSHGAMAARLAGYSGMRAAFLHFRLAPESPFPAAVDDVFCGYKALLARGYGGKDIIVAGDSAGGGLVFSLLQRLQAECLEIPLAAVAISPWTDLSLADPSCAENDKTDAMLPLSWLQMSRDDYLDGACDKAPTASPLYGNYDAPPPTFICYSGEEVLASDSVRMAEKIRSSGGQITLVKEDDLPHVWPLYQGKLGAADKTLQQIATFIETQTGRATAGC